MTMTSTLLLRKLGKNGPNVTAIRLGLMNLELPREAPTPINEKIAFLEKAYELGCRNWDSAARYGDSEASLGRYFAKHPDHRPNVFVATKFGAPLTGGIDSTPEECKRSMANSLKMIGVDYVDLFYCHRVDLKTPIEKTVRAMRELQLAGKTKYLGLSQVSASTLRRACAVAHIDCVQVEYSPFALDIEHVGLLDACRELGVAIVAYSPLGKGMLTGQYMSRDDFEKDDIRLSFPRFSEENFPNNLKLVETLKVIAAQKGCTPGQLTLAWLLAQGPDIIPIPGTKKLKYLEENLGALEVKLSSQEVAQIREAVESAEVWGDRSPGAYGIYQLADTPEEED